MLVFSLFRSILLVERLLNFRMALFAYRLKRFGINR
jgi:hypothetical protein